MKSYALAALTALLFATPALAAPSGFLGVYMTEDRPQQGGALVEEVAPDSPAAKAGLRKGDLIKSCNGQDTATTAAFVALLGKANPGDALTLRVERDGWQKTVQVTLGDRPGKPQATPRPPQRVPQNRGFLGVYLRQGEQGEAVVDGVQPNSAAAKAKLQTGDVIRKVNGAVVTEPAGLVAALGQLGPGATVEMEIDRGGQTLTVKAVLGSRTASERPKAPEVKPAPQPAQPQPSDKQPGYIGVALEDKEGAGPLKVEDVAANSPAEKFGLRQGDVVVAVDGTEVKTVEQFVKAIEGKFAGDTLNLRIERDGWRSDVRVTLGLRPDGE